MYDEFFVDLESGGESLVFWCGCPSGLIRLLVYVQLCAACRGVQNNVVRDGAAKVQVITTLVDYTLNRFKVSHATRQSTTSQNKVLVLGPWTGPRSTKKFVQAAEEMDSALAAELRTRADVEFMSMLYKPRGFGKISNADWQMQTIKDRVS